MSETQFSSPAAVHVLLIEDADIDAQVIQNVLRQFDLVVRRVSCLSDAILTLRSDAFDVVLCDLGLPDSSGLATLETLLERNPTIPVVVMTGRGEETALRAISAGAQDYLVKGDTNANTLVRAIHYAVERGRAAEEIRDSEAHTRTILEGALDAVVSINHEGVILRWNRSAEEIFGWQRAEVLGRSLAELIIPERHREDHRCGLARFVDTGEAAFLGRRAEWTALRRDGSEFSAEVRITAEASRDGMTFTAFLADITERRRAEEERNASEAKFRELVGRYELILNGITDGVHGIDLAGRILFENPAAAAMLGWRPAELIGRPAHQTMHHSRADGTARPESECPMHCTLADGIVRRSEDDVFWRKDGTAIRVEYTAAPMVDEQGRIAGAVVMFRDISRQKQMEQQIEQGLRVASLGRVSASVAHEFNNLLMCIRPSAEWLQRKAVGDFALEKHVGHVLDAVRRGQRLTDEILRFTNPPEPRMQRLDVAMVLRRFRDDAGGILWERRMMVELPVALEVHADADQLSQVLLNLAANARNATRAGGTVTIGAAPAISSTFLREHLPEAERFTALYVRDDGCGISAEAKERIFEPFFTARKGSGTGLGLAVSWRIVTQHGGRILIDSEEGMGSTFYVILPRAI